VFFDYQSKKTFLKIASRARILPNKKKGNKPDLKCVLLTDHISHDMI